MVPIRGHGGEQGSPQHTPWVNTDTDEFAARQTPVRTSPVRTSTNFSPPEVSVPPMTEPLTPTRKPQTVYERGASFGMQPIGGIVPRPGQ